MKTTVQCLVRLVLLALLLAPGVSLAGFSIQGGQLVDDNGVPFIMRGINYPYTWFQSRPTQQDFTAMAATGANTVRIVLSTGGQWARVPGAQVSQVIQWAKDNRMIAVLEVHDSTGWSEQSTAVPISDAVAYWTSADIRAAIDGQENFVIVNIANEPFGNNTSANYVPDTTAAIQALRAAGLTHTIMIDAANWGQDWSNTMRDNAMQLWNADPLRNLLFSVHMYEVYQTAAPIVAYMQAFDDLGLPLVIGEFGPQNNGQPVDVETVFAQAQQRGNGYIGWSWSGNGSGGVALDMVENLSCTFTSWGERIVNGANGIRATSVRASVFANGGNNLSVAPASLSFAAAASSSPVAVTADVGWTVTDDQPWLSVAPTSGNDNGSFTVSAAANAATTARSGTVTVSGGGLSRPIAVTQAGQSSPIGPVTASGLVTSSSGWFTEQQLRLANTATLTALSITITVQRTTGVSASGQYNTVGGIISQSNSSTAATITYLFSLSSGQSLSPGSNRVFAVQMSGNGTVHPSSGDTYTVSGTAGGQPFTVNGTF